MLCIRVNEMLNATLGNLRRLAPRRQRRHLDKLIQVKMKYGTATIPAGTTLPVVSRDANGVVVQYIWAKMCCYRRDNSPRHLTKPCSRRPAGLFPPALMIKILPEIAFRALARRG